VDAHNAIGDAHYRALRTGLSLNFEPGDFAFDKIADFRRVELHEGFSCLKT
jgi:hypothetical protein